jgi:glycosyltransferase involved in cell wall biosynthesis
LVRFQVETLPRSATKLGRSTMDSPASPQRLRATVAIPTYNRATTLRQTLEGLVKQDLPADQFEILVIDNNSTDDTAAVVGEFASARPAPRHIVEKLQGLDHARNRAIREARGEILVLGDDDILLEPDWLRRMLEPWSMGDAARIGAVGGEVIPVFPDGLPEWVAEWHAPLSFRPDAGPLPDRHSPMGANLAIPTRIFSEIGPFLTSLDRAGGNYFSGGARKHAFDSARSRVIDRASRPGAAGYLLSRLVVNLLKVAGYLLLAGINAIVLRTGSAKKALVRAWRSCGYLYQIPRSLAGRI